MNKFYKFFILVVAAIMLVTFSNISMAVLQTNTLSYPEGYEEQGYEPGKVFHGNRPDSQQPVITEAIPDSIDVLLIPQSDDDFIAMHDPETGDLIGIFIPSFDQFQTPVCAIEGPDENIYISDQVSDAVFIFDREGNYVETYADAGDGLNNIRGIDFRDGHLFVTSGDDYVAEFDSAHSRLADFINDGTDSFDILFLEDGSALLANIQGSTDDIRLYNADGTLRNQLFAIDFPEQIQVDDDTPDGFINAAFSADLITFFDTTTVLDSIVWDGGRGVYRLGNGNILATNSDGVFELDPVTGETIEQKSEGSSRFIELIPARFPTSIGDNSRNIPARYTLEGNYPNPFNTSTLIKYGLPQPSKVTLEVYDVLGRKVETLLDEYQSAGYHQVLWQADYVSSGVYLYKLTAGDYSQISKMMLIK